MSMSADQTTRQISPVAALRAASGRIDMLEGYYPNRVKILEDEKLALEERVAELEQQLAALRADASGQAN